LETIKKYKPSHPLLIEKIEAIIFWRRPKTLTTSELFLPNNVCGLGFVLSGELQVKYNENFVVMPKFGTRNTLEKPSEIRTIGDFFNISIRLNLPNTISVFTKVPINEVYQNNYFSLSEIFGSTETILIMEQLLDQENDEKRQLVLEEFLVQKLINNSNILFEEIINFIHITKGNSTVFDLSQKFNISERTINRHFNKYVGINPINYINLIRFRSIISLSNSNNLSLIKNALDVGYYDQSHFIKHFKEFSTITPKQFFDLENNSSLSDFYNI
jgi:AraC-like DNA-binding protein